MDEQGRLAALLERAWDEETITENPWPFIADRLIREGVTFGDTRLREAAEAFIDWYDQPGRSYIRDGSGPAAIAALRAAVTETER